MTPSRDSRVIRIVLITLFVLVIGYGVYEGRGLLYGPEINVPEEQLVVHEALTTVKGLAVRITELRLNGKVISVTEEGAFEEDYLLAEGSNHLILEARDARGRTARKTIDIIYTPRIGSSLPATPTDTAESE